MNEEEEHIAKKSWIHRRWKSLVLSLLILVLTLLAIIPYLYSNRIFQPIIKETFSQLTHDKYHLDFKDVSWNIFKSSFSLNEIHVIPSIGDSSITLEGNTIEVLHLDHIKIKGIDYFSFLSGKLKFRYLGLDGLYVQINNNRAIDSLTNSKKTNKVISEWLSSILIKEIDIQGLNTSYLVDKDSLIVFNDANFLLNGFYLDSLNYHIPYRIPSFDSVSIGLEKSIYLGEKNQFIMSQFLFSAGYQFSNPNIEFSKLELINKENSNSTQLNNGLIQVVLNEFFSSLKNGDFKIPDAYFHFNSLVNKVEEQAEFDLDGLLVNVQKEMEKIKANMILDNFRFEIDTIINSTPKQLIKLGQLKYHLHKAQIVNHNYNYQSYQISTGNLVYESMKKKDKFLVQSISYNEETQDLVLNNIFYKDSLSSVDFRLEKANIKQLKLISALRKKQFIVDELILTQPKLLVMQHQDNQETNLNKINWEVDINLITVEQMDLDLQPFGLVIDNCELIMDSLLIPANTQIVWPRIFNSFNVDFEKLDYTPSNKPVTALVENTRFESSNGRLNSAKFHFELNNKDTIKSINLRAEQVLVDGIDWRSLLKNKTSFKLDSLSSSSLSLNGFVTGHSSSNSALDSLFNFACKYISLPNIQVDIDLPNQEQLAHINLEKFGVYAQDFSFDMNDDEFIAFTDFKLSSQYSSFWQASDSFLLSEWNLDLSTQIFDAEGFEMVYNTENKIKKIKSHLEFELPTIHFTGVNPMAYYLKHSIELDSVYIEKPELRMWGEQKSKIEFKGESQNFYETFRQMVARFSVISFNHLLVSDFKIDVENQYIDRLGKLNIDRINLGIHGFYLDYTSLNRMEKFLFSDEISLKIYDYSQSINNDQYTVTIKEAGISNVNNRLYFKELKLLSLGNMGGGPVNVFVQDILFKDFNLIPKFQKPELYIGNVVFNSSKFKIRNKKKIKSKKFNLEELNLYPLISQQFSSVSIDQLEFNDMDLNMPDLQIGSQKNISLDGIHLIAEEIKIDSNNRIFTQDKFLYCDNINLDLPQFQFKTSNHFYQIGFHKFSFSSRNKNIMVDSLYVMPTYDKETFTNNLKYQTDRVELMVPRLTIGQLDFRDMVFRERYKAQKITIDKPEIAFYKDKTIATDTTVFKAMPAQMLAELPFYLNIDTVEIINGKLQYEELSTNMKQTGIINFDQLSAQVTGISNDADLRNYGGALKLTANAYIMSKSLVTMSTVFPLNSTNQEFILIASMGPINALEFNPIIQPLTLISAKSGELSQMQMNVRANEDYGIGEMMLKYSDLKVEVLKKKNLEESQLISFLANAIFLKTNNNSIFGPRKGAIYFERNKHRGVFNYISHFAIMGAKTSIGIDNRKTKRNIKSVSEKNK